jgi:hypothetical protein
MSLDWSPFGGNPVPGDPGVVQQLAAQLRDFSEQVKQQGLLLRQIHDGVSEIWVGPASRSFSPHVGRLTGQLGEVHTAHGSAADALDGYWPQLQDAQAMATTALARAHAASQAQQAAATARQQDYQQYQQQQAAQASQAQQQGATFNPGLYTPSPWVVAQAQQAETAWQAAIQLKDQAVSQAQAAARRAAAQLDAVARPNVQNALSGLVSTLLHDLEQGGENVEDYFRKHQAELTGLLLMLAGLPPFPPGGFNPNDLRNLLSQAGQDIKAFFQEHGEAILEQVSTIAGDISFCLSLAALAIAFIPGVDAADAVLEPLSEAASVVQLGADAILVTEYGNKEAQDRLKWDVLAVASGGIARVGEVGLTALRAAARAGDDAAVASMLFRGSDSLAQAAERLADRGNIIQAVEAWNHHLDLLAQAGTEMKQAGEVFGEAHGVSSVASAIRDGLAQGFIPRIEHNAETIQQELPQLPDPGRELRTAASAAKLGWAPVAAGVVTIGGKAGDMVHMAHDEFEKYTKFIADHPVSGDVPRPQPAPGPAPAQNQG